MKIVNHIPAVQLLIFSVCRMTKAEENKEQQEAVQNLEKLKNPKTASELLGEFGYNPNHGYEPYWEGGEWAIDPKSLLPDKKVKNENIQVCGANCPDFYVHIGRLCALKIKSGTVNNIPLGNYTQSGFPEMFITMSSYCEFLSQQCTEGDDDVDKLIFVHLGKCKSVDQALPKKEYSEIEKRKKVAISLQTYQTINSPFVISEFVTMTFPSPKQT